MEMSPHLYPREPVVRPAAPLPQQGRNIYGLHTTHEYIAAQTVTCRTDYNRTPSLDCRVPFSWATLLGMPSVLHLRRAEDDKPKTSSGRVPH
jgi:hypothetical protein